MFLFGEILFLGVVESKIRFRSSTEAELHNLTHVTCDVLWLQSLLAKLCIPHLTPLVIWVDNLGAVTLYKSGFPFNNQAGRG